MSYVVDKNNTPVLDENGNKIQFNVEYLDTDDWYKHKEALHINNDGHLDTEDRHIIIKDAINNDHACSYRQLIQKLLELETKINNVIKLTETKILQNIIAFRNEQIKDRIGRKYFRIPKTTHIIHPLLNASEIDNIEDLSDILILNVYIKRLNWYYDSRSAHCEDCFKNALEMMFNADMTTYYCFFTKIDTFWDLACIIEWIVIPEIISSNENNNNINNENKPYIPNINIVPDGNN